jgi:glycosidase
VRHPESPDGLLHEFSGDVVKLNYQNPQVAKAQIEVLRQITTLGVDGVRCDMAHFMPLEFWHQAISEVKARNPEFLFVAEAYSGSPFDWSTSNGLLAVGFDAVYHGSLYRNLMKVFVEHDPTEYLVGHLNFVLGYEHRNRLVHYLANHDDKMPAQVAPFQEGLMSLLFCMPGTTLIYNGQLNGLTRRLKHHAVDILPRDLCEFEKLPPWFETLSRLKRTEQPVLQEIKMSQGGLLSCPLAGRFGKGELYVNLSRDGSDLPMPNHRRGQGLINGFMPGQRLPRGKAEIFLDS